MVKMSHIANTNLKGRSKEIFHQSFELEQKSNYNFSTPLLLSIPNSCLGIVQCWHQLSLQIFAAKSLIEG
jgi:hypothetical protein